jgi:hypothetical protein
MPDPVARIALLHGARHAASVPEPAATSPGVSQPPAPGAAPPRHDAATPASPPAEPAIPAETPAEARARRARENGAKSRGPVTAEGKRRASMNALRHGLTAEVHLVLPREDEAAFLGLATGLLADLAPSDTLEACLVAQLAAAFWKAGRAERLESQAFQAGPEPDPDRLRLALRY